MKLALNDHKEGGENGLTRRGHPIYRTNPSITSSPLAVRIRNSEAKKMHSAYMVAPDTGEVLGRGAFGFIEEKEVDSTEFVKLYLDGIRKYGELGKPGSLLFEFVYRQMSGKAAKDKDQITLSYLLALEWKPDLTKRTFYRGMNELLEKGFLFRTLATDVYFVNVRFMFNGDRLVVANAYYLKGSQTQHELPLGGPSGDAARVGSPPASDPSPETTRG